MGPSLGRLGDSEHFRFSEFASRGPQWGRASEGSETRRRRPRRCWSDAAAMGPSLGRLGDCGRPSALELRAPVVAANGAEPRKARRLRSDVHPERRRPRRNGAEPRKARRLPMRASARTRAQLVPQWGRASEGSETSRWARPNMSRRRSRNGAEPRKARRRHTGHCGSCKGKYRPQWGRASEGSETEVAASARQR